MPLFRNAQPLPDEPILRWILIVLAFSTIAAALLLVAAHYLWKNEALAEVAGWSAVVTGLIYFFFRWWGGRAAARDRERS